MAEADVPGRLEEDAPSSPELTAANVTAIAVIAARTHTVTLAEVGQVALGVDSGADSVMAPSIHNDASQSRNQSYANSSSLPVQTVSSESKRRRAQRWGASAFTDPVGLSVKLSDSSHICHAGERRFPQKNGHVSVFGGSRKVASGIIVNLPVLTLCEPPRV